MQQTHLHVLIDKSASAYIVNMFRCWMCIPEHDVGAAGVSMHSSEPSANSDCPCMNHPNTPLLRKHGLSPCLVVQSVWVAANLVPWAHKNADLNFQGISGRPPLSPADQRRWFTVISRESLQDPAPLFNEYLAGGLLSKLHHANPSEMRLSW